MSIIRLVRGNVISPTKPQVSHGSSHRTVLRFEFQIMHEYFWGILTETESTAKTCMAQLGFAFANAIKHDRMCVVTANMVAG